MGLKTNSPTVSDRNKNPYTDLKFAPVLCSTQKSPLLDSNGDFCVEHRSVALTRPRLFLAALLEAAQTIG